MEIPKTDIGNTKKDKITTDPIPSYINDDLGAHDTNESNFDPVDYAVQQGQAVNEYGLWITDKEYAVKQNLKYSILGTLQQTKSSIKRAIGHVSEMTGLPLNLSEDDGVYTHEELIKDNAEFYENYPYDTDAVVSELGTFSANLAPTVLTAGGGTALKASGFVKSAAVLTNTHLGIMSMASFGNGITRMNEVEKMNFESDPNFEGFSDLHKSSVGMGYAITTLMVERFALEGWSANMLKDQSLIKELGEAYIKGNRNKFSATAQIIIGDMHKMGKIEGAEESIEQALHNFIDFTYDPRPAHLLENVLQAYGYGYLSGGIMGPSTTFIRMSQHSELLDLSRNEGISLAELSSRIVKIASAEEIMMAEHYQGGVKRLIDKYGEWKEIQPWANNPEAWETGKLHMDVGSKELLDDELGDVTIDDIKKQGFYIFNKGDYPKDGNYDSTKDGEVRLVINEKMTNEDIEKALIVMAFIKRKAPTYFKNLNTANFTRDWKDGVLFGNPGGGTYGFFRADENNPGIVNIKLLDRDGDPIPLDRVVNTLAHEMMHNRDFVKYGNKKFKEMFKILTGPNEGRYSFEGGIPWGDYRNVKGEDRAFKIGATTGAAFSKFINMIHGLSIDKAKQDGGKAENAKLELTNEIMIELDNLWRDYKMAGIPLSQFVNDISETTNNRVFMDNWVQSKIEKGDVIWDTPLIRSTLRKQYNGLTPTELDMSINLLKLWANSQAFKLSSTGTEVTANEIISNFIGDINSKAGPHFNKDGKALIRTMKNGTFKEFVTTLVPLFTKSLTKMELDAIESWAGVKNGKWTKKNNEKFVAGIVRWLRSGGDLQSTTPFQKEVFAQMSDHLKKLYKNIRGTNLDVGLTKDMRVAFTQLFGLQNIDQELSQVKNLVQQGLDIAADWGANLFAYVDVESPFKRLNAPKTGFHIKNYFSRINAELFNAERVTIEIAKLLNNDTEKIKKFILMFEKPKEFYNYVNGLNEIESAQWEAAYKIWETYWKDSLTQLQKMGILKEGFVDNMKHKIAKTILEVEGDIKLINEGDTIQDKDERYNELVDELNYLTDLFKEINENLNFVHLPILLLLEDLGGKRKINVTGSSGKKFRMLMQDRRSTLYISDLINDGFINFNDISLGGIMASYATRFATDIAKAEIVNAAKAEGLAIHKDDANFDVIIGLSGLVPMEGEHFKSFGGYYLDPVLLAYLKEFGNHSHTGEFMDNWDVLMSTYKLTTFANPWFLAMYDAMQGSVAMAFWNPINWVKGDKSITYAWVSAAKDFFTMSDNWYLAERNGLRSTPFGDKFRDVNRQFESGENKNTFFNSKFLGVVLRPFTSFVDSDSKLRSGPAFLKALFETSHQVLFSTAWTMDGIVRQVTYNYLVKNGYSPHEAAQDAAKWHGDYAGVPSKTRRLLNKMFYTPTFKIAMMKLYGDMMTGVASVPLDIINKTTGTNLGKDTSRKARFGYGIIGVAVLNQLAGMFMKGHGWEEERWGRRWSKSVKNALGEKQELYATTSNPFNIIQRFAERFDKIAEPDSAPITGLMKAFKFEFHPLLVAIQAVTENRAIDGSPIWFEGSSKSTARIQALTYLIKSGLKVTEGAKFGYAEDTSTMREEFAREAFHKEFPEYLQSMLTVIDQVTYTYMTASSEVKEVNRLKSSLNEVKVGIEQLKQLYVEQLKALPEGEQVAFPIGELHKILAEWSEKVEHVSQAMIDSDPMYSILNDAIRVDMYKKVKHQMYPDITKFVQVSNSRSEVYQMLLDKTGVEKTKQSNSALPPPFVQ